MRKYYEKTYPKYHSPIDLPYAEVPKEELGMFTPLLIKD